nr:hypothetical protein [Oleomonas cavernae]
MIAHQKLGTAAAAGDDVGHNLVRDGLAVHADHPPLQRAGMGDKTFPGAQPKAAGKCRDIPQEWLGAHGIEAEADALILQAAFQAGHQMGIGAEDVPARQVLRRQWAGQGAAAARDGPGLDRVEPAAILGQALRRHRFAVGHQQVPPAALVAAQPFIAGPAGDGVGHHARTRVFSGS